MRNRIVCGIDGSKASRLAARVAGELAGVLGRRLVLAYATDDPPTFPYGDARLRELQRRRATHAASRLLEGVAAELPAIAPETTVLFGDPGDALNSLCRDREAALLVLGSEGRSGLTAALHGSLSARFASTGECPVVVVPPDAADRFLRGWRTGGSVVCGVDGSGESARALQLATGIADRLRLELVPVFVTGSAVSATPSSAGVPVQIDPGDPIDGIRVRAMGEEARLIVVGSRGHGALRGAVLGSVSRALVADAPAPVLVVPPTARLTGLAAETARNELSDAA